MNLKARCKDRAFWKKVILWSLLLCIAPVAIEMLFLADIMGIEIAMAFFAYYLKDMALIWQARFQHFSKAVGLGVMCLASHATGQPNYFFSHLSLSVVYFLLSGSVIWALLVWYPNFVLGGSTMAGY